MWKMSSILLLASSFIPPLLEDGEEGGHVEDVQHPLPGRLLHPPVLVQRLLLAHILQHTQARLCQNHAVKHRARSTVLGKMLDIED